MAKKSANNRPAPAPSKNSIATKDAVVWLPREPWRSLLLFSVPLLVYARTIGFDFTHHDDDRMIVENAAALARGFDWGFIFGTDAWFMPGQIELYRPWQSLTYVADYRIGGLSPWVYHLHNVLIFCLNAVLLDRLLFSFLRHARWAFYGALLYSVHFLFVHAVCWIPARGDLYLFFFGVSALIALQRYLRSGGAGWLMANAGLSFLAMLSKESAVVLPVVGAAMLYLHRRDRPVGMPAAAWAVVSAALVGLYLVLRSGAVAAGNNLSVAAFLSNLRTLPEETAKLLLPVGFSVMPVFTPLATGLGVLAIAGLGWWIVRGAERMDARTAVPAAALLALSLIPSLVYAPSFAGMAYDYLDHRAYFGFLGLWILLLERGRQSRLLEKKWAAPVLLAALALSAATDWVFSTAYRDKWAYYENALRTNPASGLANLNYGIFLRQEGDHKMAEALPYFEKAVAGSPGYYDGHLRLAECLNILGRSREALPHADEALRLLGEKNWPDALKGDAHSVRGAIRGKLGDHAAALQDFEAARRYKSADPSIAYNLGLALRNVGRREEALALFEEAVAQRPDYAEAWYELGFNNGVLNRFDAAKRALDQAIRLRPENADALLFRGLAQQSLGNLPAACADWQKAAQLGKQEAAAFGQQHCQ